MGQERLKQCPMQGMGRGRHVTGEGGHWGVVEGTRGRRGGLGYSERAAPFCSLRATLRRDGSKVLH